MATITGTDVADNMHGTAQADVMWMKGGYDEANGWGGADEIHGGPGDDRLHGNDGADTLYGDAGSDYLYGEAGGDVLVGGDGTDLLWGGAGNDEFRFAKASTVWDMIYDFNRLHDVIDLSAIDANWNRAGDQAYTLIGENAFSGHAGELRYTLASGGDGAITWLYGDNDGDRNADFVLGVQGLNHLSNSDFIL